MNYEICRHCEKLDYTPPALSGEIRGGGRIVIY